MDYPATTASVPTSLDSSSESATTSLYRAAIGPINNDFYLPIFTRFETADRSGHSWNWAASLYTLNWMVFRQLWQAALAYVMVMFAVGFLGFGLGRLVFQFSEMTEIGLLVSLAILSFVIPGVYGNAIFYLATRKKMARALSDSSTLREACTMLDRQAASRRRFIWLTILNVALTAVAAAAYAVFSDIGPPHFGSQTASLSVSATLAKLPLPPASSAQVLPVPALTVSAPNPAIVSSAPASLISTPLAIVKDVNAVPCKDCVRDAIASAGASTQGVGKPDTLKPVSEHASKAVMDTRAAAFSSYVPRRPLAASSTEPKVTNPPANKLTASKPYFINVGVFADDTNARNAYTKLLASGLTAYKQELNTAKGKRTRVRVGPFDTRSEADTAAKKILALKLDAMVSRQ